MHAAAAPATAPATAPAAAPATAWQRALPIACGCALTAAAAAVKSFDPAASGSRFPACQFHSLTGWWCPGCGLTRGFHHLFNGHLGAAMSYNVFVPFVLVAAVVGWASWLRTSWGRNGLRVPAGITRAAAIGMPVLLVVYGVLRNLPGTPFRSLAP